MCRVCDEVTNLSQRNGLIRISQAIKDGTPPEHFKKAMDKLLGTEEPEVVEEADEAFERSRR